MFKIYSIAELRPLRIERKNTIQRHRNLLRIAAAVPHIFCGRKISGQLPAGAARTRTENAAAQTPAPAAGLGPSTPLTPPSLVSRFRLPLWQGGGEAGLRTRFESGRKGGLRRSAPHPEPRRGALANRVFPARRRRGGNDVRLGHNTSCLHSGSPEQPLLSPSPGAGGSGIRLGRMTERMDCTEKTPKHSGFAISYVTGDLFQCPAEESLAHCISEDCRMGAGIAVTFRNKFQSIAELRSQKKKTGEVAVLKRNRRYIYYLITKKKAFQKPTYESLQSSLEALKRHCINNQVTRISMPRIGCGLDKLIWNKVAERIRDVFQDTDIVITVYSLGDSAARPFQWKRGQTGNSGLPSKAKIAK